LDLGPLHHSIRCHILVILDNPDLIFGTDIQYQTATLNGLQWADPKAMKAVFDLIPSLPHIKPITLAFFRGALTTWIRFSAEFAPGGLIDACTATEKQLAWMPSTNDANEGALGAYRVMIRGKPSLTLHQYNAQAMFRRNQTQDFMDAVFTPEDHAYIMQEARRIEASGEEARRRNEIVDFRLKTAETQKAKALAKVQKDAEVLQENLTRLLVPLSKMDALTVPLIHEQLNAYRARGVPDILANSKYPRKAEKLAALKTFAAWYKVNGMPPVLPSVPQSVSELAPIIAEGYRDEEDVEMEEGS
jgi:DNA-binding phage protein